MSVLKINTPDGVLEKKVGETAAADAVVQLKNVVTKLYEYFNNGVAPRGIRYMEKGNMALSPPLSAASIEFVNSETGRTDGVTSIRTSSGGAQATVTTSTNIVYVKQTWNMFFPYYLTGVFNGSISKPENTSFRYSYPYVRKTSTGIQAHTAPLREAYSATYPYMPYNSYGADIVRGITNALYNVAPYEEKITKSQYTYIAASIGGYFAGTAHNLTSTSHVFTLGEDERELLPKERFEENFTLKLSQRQQIQNSGTAMVITRGDVGHDLQPNIRNTITYYPRGVANSIVSKSFTVWQTTTYRTDTGTYYSTSSDVSSARLELLMSSMAVSEISSRYARVFEDAFGDSAPYFLEGELVDYELIEYEDEE